MVLLLHGPEKPPGHSPCMPPCNMDSMHIILGSISTALLEDLALCHAHHLMLCTCYVGKLLLLHLGTRIALGWTEHSQEARVLLSGSCCFALLMLQPVLHQRLQSKHNGLHFVRQLYFLGLSVWVGVWAGCKKQTAAVICCCCMPSTRIAC